MTKNTETLANIIISAINTEYDDSLPTTQQIYEKANEFRVAMDKIYPISDDDFQDLKKYLDSKLRHKIEFALSLKGVDAEHRSWYLSNENEKPYWERYREYLILKKHWSKNVVTRLNETTDNIMDDLGDPNDTDRPFHRKGLLLGDVQSGKTATYTAICNKATDAGYKVIIVLAGMMENLRVQTQKRLDLEYVGYDSKNALDKNNGGQIKNTPVGVGLIPPEIDASRRVSCFTSVATDFNISTLKSVGLSLKTLNGTALFVVKKNKSVLNNLYKWLIKNNLDSGTDVIDLPLLLIDDESDNASINTNSEEKDPTAINKAIRSILDCFRQASYVGITATPFANIFIDPESYGDSVKDLFPEHFLTVLPTPSDYIGAKEIFGSGNADNWDSETALSRKQGDFAEAIIPIYKEEQESFFRFKHKKDLALDLDDLPESLLEAIRYFVVATAVSDLRNDKTEHRSMLVNTSRFTDVQNRTTDLIYSYVTSLKEDLENYSQISIDKSGKIFNIAMLKDTWEKYCVESIAGISWERFLKTYLLNAIKRIEVRSVNQKTGARSLDYDEYKNVGLRVIAVGGNSLSRGITLEGLCVSYFYRNTMMYDTLLQMGRWFGYRYNYEDLFKIWMADDAIDWYGYISDAVAELKDELRTMERAHQTPREFGLKVRQAPGALLVTARCKMRTATSIKMPITLSGRLIETPRLRDAKDILKANENLCVNFIKELSDDKSLEFVDDTFTNSFVWKKVPKDKIVTVIKGFSSHPWNLNFQSNAISNYISGDKRSNLSYWDVGIVKKGEGKKEYLFDGTEISIYPESREIKHDSVIEDMLRINGHHVKVGTGGCTKIGLSETTIKDIRKRVPKPIDRDYLIKDRRPLMLIHVLENNVELDKRASNDPDIVFALSLGFPDDGIERTANYVVNIRELSNWVEITDEDDDYDD